MVDLHLIKHARLTKGYSQEKLAFDMGLSQSQYSRRENGIIEMNIDELNKIFIILELKADDYVWWFQVANAKISTSIIVN
jgi:transcriptional regulator with XRE-family HTH domain